MNGEPREESRAVNTGSLFWGLALMGFGVLLLLDQFDIADFGDIVRTWWPMAIVIIGVSQLLSPEKRWNGAWVTSAGILLQMARLHAFGMTIGTAWPFFLILLGGMMIVKALVRGSRPSTPPGANHGA